MNTTIIFLIGFLGGVLFTLAGVQKFVSSASKGQVLAALKYLRRSKK